MIRISCDDSEIRVRVEYLFGYAAWFDRWINEWDYDRIGQMVVDDALLNSIETGKELLELCKERKLFSYTDQYCMDIDEAMEFLLRCHGDDFVPDPEENWYILQDGLGVSGEKAFSYMNAYQDAKEDWEHFLNDLYEYENEEILEIIIELKPSGSKEWIIYEKSFMKGEK